jgi:hypothetical protein
MASAIDPSRPADGVPASKPELRANLAAARTEIEHAGFHRARPTDPLADAPAFAGSVERSGRDKLSEVVSILDFGVRPNAGHDYTAEFENAFRQLSSVAAFAGRSKTLFVPAGRYHMAEADWTGRPALWGEPGMTGAVQLFYAGRGGEGSCLIRHPHAENNEVGQTSINNMQLHGMNPDSRALAESIVRLERKVDWPFGLNNCFLVNAGKYGVNMIPGHFNATFHNLRSDNIGWYTLWTGYDRQAGHGRPISVTGLWTFDNSMDGDRRSARLWADQGHIPPGPHVESELDWFGRGFIGMTSKNTVLQLCSGRAEQQDRCHPDFAIVVDDNQESNSVNYVHMTGVTGYYGGSWETPGFVGRSFANRCKFHLQGFCALSRQSGLLKIGDTVHGSRAVREAPAMAVLDQNGYRAF